MAKRIMRELKIDEISSVTNPAQKGARAVIMKSADVKATKRDLSRIRNALREANFEFDPSQLSKFAERLAEDAMSAAPADARLFVDAENPDNQEQLNKNYAALCVSVESIFADADAVNKSDLLQATFQQFKDALQGVASGGVEDTITRALAEGDNGGSMSKAIAKALGLAETATEAEILAAVVKSGSAEVKELTDKLAKAEALNKLSGKHKAFMESDKAKMPTGGKDAFVAMSPAQRDAHMSANAMDAEDAADGGSDESTEKMIKSGDAYRTVKGTVVRKSVVGAEVFKILKDQDEDIRKSNERADKADAETRKASFTKKAEGFAKVGKPDELGELLAKTAAHEPALADAWSVVLSTAEERIAKGGLFEERGSSARGFSKAFDGINAKAQELLSKGEKPFNSIEKCRVEVRKRFPDLAKQEQDEQREAKKAA